MATATDFTAANSKALAIVVGLGFTEADGPAFDQAGHIAQMVRGSQLHLVHVFGEEPSVARARRARGPPSPLYVNEKAGVTHGLGGVTVGIHLRSGRVAREIVQLATDGKVPYLIVVGSHRGPHLKHWIVGSTAERLMAGAPCPVLVTSPPPKEPEKHEPTVEPACPQCLEARTASKGARWWCERHSHSANMGHSFSYQRELPFATHDSRGHSHRRSTSKQRHVDHGNGKTGSHRALRAYTGNRRGRRGRPILQNRFWERLMVNVGIDLGFAPLEQRLSPRCQRTFACFLTKRVPNRAEILAQVWPLTAFSGRTWPMVSCNVP